jgi:hypothetical protein
MRSLDACGPSTRPPLSSRARSRSYLGMVSAPFLGIRKRTTLRSRRRVAACAYVLAALASGLIVIRTLSGGADDSANEASPRVEISWRTALDAHIDILPLSPGGWGNVPAADPDMHEPKPKFKAKPKAKAGKATKEFSGAIGGAHGQDVLEIPPAVPYHHPPNAQETDRTFQPHTWRSDGLLDVNPDGRHPIFDLMECAQREWNEKLARQSKSLDEVVSEYRRRYGRALPKGFD